MSAVSATIDRVSFFDEQKRRRRGAARMSLLCLGIAGLIGAILSTVIGPLVVALVVLVLKALEWTGIAATPASALRHSIETWIANGLVAVNRILDWVAGDPSSPEVAAANPASALVFLLPSILLAIVFWWWMKRMQARTSAEAAIAGLGARDPRPGDFEETQLANVIAEMALAAGIPTPRLAVIDTERINAAATGSSHRDATIIVTRGLLDSLDRNETVGVVAHLTGAIGNGDLRLAAAIESVFVTLGTFLSVLDLPFRWGAWTGLGAMLRAIVIRPSGATAEHLTDTLTASLSTKSFDSINRVMKTGERWPPLGALLIFPLIPICLVVIMQKLIVSLWMLFFLNWPIARLWWNRRFLADSVAVQLTRDPDGLIRALQRINDEKKLPDGGVMHELAFIHAPDAEMAGLRERFHITMGLSPRIGNRIGHLQRQAPGGVLVERGQAAITKVRALWAERPLIALLLTVLLAAIVPLVGVLLVCVAMLTAFTLMISVGVSAVLMTLLVGG